MTTTTLTIKRPDGTYDRVIRPGTIALTLRKQMTQATRNAGRGEIVGWQVNKGQKASSRKANPYTRTTKCKMYNRETGCPMHGETCAPEYGN